MQKHTRQGIVCLISGPSGSGKTTLCQRLVEEGEAVYSISCTTRKPREGEVDGENYYFLSRKEFQAQVDANAFLEHAEVHGSYYGTLKSEVTSRLEQGIDVVMDIDVQGAQLLRELKDLSVKKALVDIFILPPNIKTLKERLGGRAADSEETLLLRLKNAQAEMEQWQKYTYCVLSNTKEEDYRAVLSILKAERQRVSRWTKKEQK